jgi:hypothetical protein
MAALPGYARALSELAEYMVRHHETLTVVDDAPRPNYCLLLEVGRNHRTLGVFRVTIRRPVPPAVGTIIWRDTFEEFLDDNVVVASGRSVHDFVAWAERHLSAGARPLAIRINAYVPVDPLDGEYALLLNHCIEFQTGPSRLLVLEGELELDVMRWSGVMARMAGVYTKLLRVVGGSDSDASDDDWARPH